LGAGVAAEEGVDGRWLVEGLGVEVAVVGAAEELPVLAVVDEA
jgi:hypothetical protein